MAQRGRIFPVPFEGVAAPEFGPDGGRAPALRSITIDLSVARDKEEIEIGGNFLWASNATDNSTEVSIAFARETADEGILFKNGTRISGLPFSRVFLTNAIQGTKTITFTYATEAFDTGLEIDNAAGDFAAVSTTKPTSSAHNADQNILVAGAAFAGSGGAAATPTRRRLVVEADINNTEDLRVGPIVTDTTGRVLTPGAFVEIFSTVSIAIRNPSTNLATQVWRYYEELD